MNAVSPKCYRLEQSLAALLNYGSWIASSVIFLGLALALVDSYLGTHDLAVVPNTRIATTGIVLFILLPALRVLLMFIVFIRERDYRLAIIAAAVMTIVVTGFVLGMRSSSRIAE